MAKVKPFTYSTGQSYNRIARVVRKEATTLDDAESILSFLVDTDEDEKRLTEREADRLRFEVTFVIVPKVG